MAAGGIGTQLSSPPITLVNMANAITQKYLAPYLTDAVFLPSPFFWRLTRHGRRIHGGAIAWPVINQEELTGGAYLGTQLLATDVTDSVQPAELQWRAYQQLIAIPLLDAVLNQGFAQSVNLVKAKEEIAYASLLMKLQRAVQRTGRGWWGPNQFVIATRRAPQPAALVEAPLGIDGYVAQLARRMLCPSCAGALRWATDMATCTACGTHFERRAAYWNFVP